MRYCYQRHVYHPRGAGRAPRTYTYARALLSAAETGDRRRMIHLPLTPEIERLIREQRRQREKRRLTRRRMAQVRHGVPGRPRIHHDRALLDYLGLRHEGGRLRETRRLTLEERARRRYGLLAPEWRALLSEEQYVEVEREVRAMRKRANRCARRWDPHAAWRDAMDKALGQTHSVKERDDDETATTHRTVPHASMPQGGQAMSAGAVMPAGGRKKLQATRNPQVPRKKES